MIIVIITTVFLIIEGIYITRKPIYFVSDSFYYESIIKNQKYKLKYKSLINNSKIVYIIDSNNDGSWINYDYKKNSIIVLSPYISMLMEYENDISFDNNFLVSIDNELKKANLNVKVDYISGFEKLADKLKNKGKNIYLISSKDWPTSISKANAFESRFSNSGLTKIELKGNELEQSAYDIIDKINKEESVEIVSTGNTLMSYFINVENNIVYNLEAYQSVGFDKNLLHYVIYEDLSLLFEKDIINKEDIVLSTKLKDHQEGLINFFLHFLRDLQSIIF